MRCDGLRTTLLAVRDVDGVELQWDVSDKKRRGIEVQST